MTKATVLGDVEVTSLIDMRGSLGPLATNFPDVPESAWNEFRSRYPDLFGGGDEFAPPFGSFLLHLPDIAVLVDTGVGAAGNDFLPDIEGRLLTEIEDSGTGLTGIDIVFLTHLHVDHVGWNMIDTHPTFPNARYIASREGWEWTLDSYRDRKYVHQQLVPLTDSGRLELVDGATELAHGLRALPTPGHFPGHMSLEVHSGDVRIFVLGDVAVSPAQITNPDWEYIWDEDKPAATETRGRMIADLERDDTFVLCGHYPNGGVGRLVRHDRIYWEPIPANS